jgi:hypothetical protein
VNHRTWLPTLGDTTWKLNSIDAIGSGQIEFRCRERPQPTLFAADARSASPKARSTLRGRPDAKIATFDPRIEGMRFAPGSAAKAPAELPRVMYPSRR